MKTHTSGYRRNTYLSFNAGNLGGHPTRLSVLPRKDNVLTRVSYMMRSEARIRPVWFDAVRKFPPIPFGPHTRIKDIPKMSLAEDRLARVYARRHAASSWVESLVPENRAYAETSMTPGNELVTSNVTGKRYLSPAFEFARRQYYLMEHKGLSESDAFAEAEKSFAKFVDFDRERTDKLLQRASLAGAKLYLSPTERLGEEKAIINASKSRILQDRSPKPLFDKDRKADAAKDSFLYAYMKAENESISEEAQSAKPPPGVAMNKNDKKKKRESVYTIEAKKQNHGNMKKK